MTRYVPLLVATVWLLAGCASQPNYAPVSGPGQVDRPYPAHTNNNPATDEILDIALQLEGVPYRYGGSHPATGFDCSGFIQFTHRRAGLRVPRTTRQQFQVSRRVAIERLRPGDLLFYDTEGSKPGHVALYLGSGKMIHAPSSGKAVTISRLDNPYWRDRLLSARRF